MKLLTKRSLFASLVIVLAVTVISAFVWVVATNQGSRWLLESVASLGGVRFSAQNIEGRIIDKLRLTKVRVDLDQQHLELDTLELRWKPSLLLAGTVAVQELVIKGVRIQDNAPVDNKPPNLVWPRVSENAQLFDGKIARLLVTNISYRHMQEQPVPVTSIAGSVTWQDGTLSVNEFKAESPSGRINGSVSAGFKQPSLTAELAIDLAQPMAEMDRFSFRARPGTISGPEPFVGTVTVSGSMGTRKMLELGGDVGMARNAFNLRRLSLTRPGQKGLISADGALTFTKLESILSLQVKLAGLDFAPELNVPTDLSGTLSFAGTLGSYRGKFTLDNQAKGWQSASVSATYQGTRDGMKLAPVTGSVLDGSLAGNLDMNWRNGFIVQGTLNGRNLNPARFDSAWKGVANFSVTGKLARVGEAPVTGNISGSLMESRLHGQTLTGELQADFSDNNLSLKRLLLQGKGFDLHASGELNKRLNLAAQINDFSLLIPGSAGTLQTQGWVRWNDEQLSGSIAGIVSKFAYAGTSMSGANLTARLEQGAGYPLHVTASLRDVVYDAYKMNAVTLVADGTLSRHVVNATLSSGSSEARLTVAAGYNEGIWKGELSRLSGRDNNGPWKLTAPAAFSVSADNVSLSTLALSAGAGERLEVAADLSLKPLNGQVRTQWSGLNLARANSYLKDMQLKGSSSGKARLDFQAGKMLAVAGSASASGTFTGQGQSIAIRQTLVNFDAGEQGMQVDVDLTEADGGRLKGSFTSPAPLRLGMPEKGNLKAELSGINLKLLKPWLPPDTQLEGHINGQAKGLMLTGKRFELNGNVVLSEGKLLRKNADGEIDLAFKTASTSWKWQEETLSGTISLAMVEHGQARGTFQLPLPARFPVAFNQKGLLRGTLVGQAQEKGIITSLFPEMVQESSGEIDAELDISGTWENPQVGGKLQLSKAGAYLPTAGIRLKDVQLAARLEKNLIRIDSFRAVSGSGHIEGTAQVHLAGWKVTSYQGTIAGENFQTVYFPELRVVSSPKLQFEGTPEKLKLRGELRLPELNIIGAQSRTGIAPSSDVILEGRVVPVAKSSPLLFDAQIRVVLGDKVLVKVAGIDAQLGGAMDLSFSNLARITSRGEIKVVKGRYRTYGVNLEIVRGRLFFAGGTINSPSLDFLALRTIGDVRAGVTVTGNLRKPITKLYSEPAMPDVDVLAYIVLGHPLGSSGQQASLLTQAAGALLTSGQAAVLQEQVKNYLGLSTLEIQGGVGGTSSAMGYKPLQVTPPGAIPTAQQPGITETVLTVGKYLTPELYISYGKSLFTGNNIFRLRYDIYKKWQIETQTGGGESGADLYYKLEFK